MSDPHDDRILNALLREVAQEDARLDGAGLEERVMTRWDAAVTVRPYDKSSRASYWVIGGIAAAVVIALAMQRKPVADRTPQADRPPRTDMALPADLKVGTTSVPKAESAVVPTFPPSLGFGEVSPKRAVLGRATADRSANAVGKPASRSVRQPQPTSVESETITFVPLGPMAAEDLSGSFQIVHVQIPRASLGALAPTLDISRASELIETDVLLGEDGMARAIRVSSNESDYPWRSR